MIYWAFCRMDKKSVDENNNAVKIKCSEKEGEIVITV
jgi:hypothetical protein